MVFLNDEINRVVLVDRVDISSGRITITHDNFDNTSAFGLEISSNYRPYKWWSINGSFDLYSQTQKGIAERLNKPIDVSTQQDIETIINKVDNVAYNFRMYNSFTATKKLSFTAFMFYRGRNKTLQFDILPMYFANIGARLNILKGKGNISLNYNVFLTPCVLGLRADFLILKMVHSIGRVKPYNSDLIIVLAVVSFKPNHAENVTMMRKIVEVECSNSSRTRQSVTHIQTCQHV